MVAYVSAIVLLLLMVAAQAAYHFRDSLVAFWPVTRPAFERFCEIASCAIRPLRDAAMSHLSIESSDLQADAAPVQRMLDDALAVAGPDYRVVSWTLPTPPELRDGYAWVLSRAALGPAVG